MNDEIEAALIAEQFRHTIDLIMADLKAVKVEMNHLEELTGNRLNALEEQGKDHEKRIRSATDGVTQFKVWSGLSTGGSWVVAIIALVRSWLI